MLLNSWSQPAHPWPAQIIPQFGELSPAGIAILLGLFVLLAAGLAVALFMLVRSRRRSRSAAADIVAVQPAAIVTEETSEDTDEVAIIPPAVAATPAAAPTPVLARLFSAESRPLEPDFAQAVSETPDEWDIPDRAVGEALTVAGLLAEGEARRHLEEVNQYVLLQYGDIREEPGRVDLSWYTTGGPRNISIAAAADERELIINGIPFDATPDGVQKGVVAYLTGLANSVAPEVV